MRRLPLIHSFPLSGVCCACFFLVGCWPDPERLLRWKKRHFEEDILRWKKRLFSLRWKKRHFEVEENSVAVYTPDTVFQRGGPCCCLHSNALLLFAFAFALFYALLLHLLSARDSNQKAAGEMAGRNLELRCRQPTKKNPSTSGCNSREECLIV